MSAEPTGTHVVIIASLIYERDEARRAAALLEAALARILNAWDAGSHAPYPIPRTALLEGLRDAIEAARERSIR